MNQGHSWRDDTAAATVSAARISQAVVISAFDRAVGGPVAPARALLARVPGVSRAVGRLDSPAAAVDDAYALIIRLTDLHREFAQRLFDVLAPQGDLEAARDDRTSLAPVVSLVTARQRVHRSR